MVIFTDELGVIMFAQYKEQYILFPLTLIRIAGLVVLVGSSHSTNYHEICLCSFVGYIILY